MGLILYIFLSLFVSSVLVWWYLQLKKNAEKYFIIVNNIGSILKEIRNIKSLYSGNNEKIIHDIDQAILFVDNVEKHYSVNTNYIFSKKLTSSETMYELCNDKLVHINEIIRIESELDVRRKKYNKNKRNGFYKKLLNKSNKIISNIDKKYPNLSNKYLIKFNSDYGYYKSNYIDSIKSLIDGCYEDMVCGDFKSIKSKLDDLDNVTIQLIAELKEPERLLDRVINAEYAINMYDVELNNNKGSLYYKVFYVIKNHKVDRTLANRWNGIKRRIINLKKKKLFSDDIIELSVIMTNIINDLSKLSSDITNIIKNKEYVSSE